MNTIDVIKQALEALEETTALCENYEAVEEPDGYQFTEAKTVIPMGKAAITNLHTAIEEIEKAEPVVWMDARGKLIKRSEEANAVTVTAPLTPLYTHPAQISEGFMTKMRESFEKRVLSDTATHFDIYEAGWNAAIAAVKEGGPMLEVVDYQGYLLNTFPSAKGLRLGDKLYKLPEDTP